LGEVNLDRRSDGAGRQVSGFANVIGYFGCHRRLIFATFCTRNPGLLQE
jgi:hypothetical protein